MHIDFRALAEALGYPAAGLGILVESAGVPFPGETMLLAVSALAAASRLDIRVVIFFGALGAVAGANLGYAIGYLGGRPLVERLSRFFRFGSGHLARSELFFARHGPLTILVGRFVLGLRTWASVMAGMARMPFWTFQLYTTAGGITWAIVIGSIGFYLGSNWPLVERVIRYLGFGGVAVATALIAALYLLRRHAERT